MNITQISGIGSALPAQQFGTSYLENSMAGKINPAADYASQTGAIGMGEAFDAQQIGASTVVENAGKFFQELVNKVNDMQQQSNLATQQLVTGENRNLHEAMIAMEKASISFQFMSQVRNKALEAYQEVMRMQV